MGLLIGIAIVFLIVTLLPISNKSSSASRDDEPYDADKMHCLENSKQNVNDFFEDDT